MGKSYLAVNEIRHGNEDGTLTVFAPGEAVTGLAKEQMVALWEAGVLTEFDPNNRPADPVRDAEIEALKAQIAQLEAEKAAAEAAAQAAAEQEPPTDEETPAPDATA